MRRGFILSLMTSILLTVSLLAVPLAYVAADDSDETEGEAELEDPGNYVPLGSTSVVPSGVTAEIEFQDDGSTLRISGEAEGLDPDIPYASLIYDVVSFAEGPIACEPVLPPDDPSPFNIFATMFVGFWDVDEDGEGELSATNIGLTFDPSIRVYVPLSKIGTISIRDLTAPNPGPPGLPGTGPAAVVACGEVDVEGFEEEVAELEDPGNHPSLRGVTGEIRFVDDGTTLRITGIARGLDLGPGPFLEAPFIRYASLIYDVDSEVDGPDACEPAIFDPADEEFILPTMFVGIWFVVPDGTGTGTGLLAAINIFNELDPTGPRVRVPLDLIGTISLRDATVLGPTPEGPMPGAGPAAVVVCGEVD